MRQHVIVVWVVVAEQLVYQIPPGKTLDIDVRAVPKLRVGKVLAVEGVFQVLHERLDILVIIVYAGYLFLGGVGIFEGVVAGVACVEMERCIAPVVVVLYDEPILADVDSVTGAFDTLCEQVDSQILSVECDLDVPVSDRVWNCCHPGQFKEVGVAQQRFVGILSQEGPVLVGGETAYGMLFVEFDPIWLLFVGPGRVAPAADLAAYCEPLLFRHARQRKSCTDVFILSGYLGEVAGGDFQMCGRVISADRRPVRNNNVILASGQHRRHQE